LRVPGQKFFGLGNGGFSVHGVVLKKLIE